MLDNRDFLEREVSALMERLAAIGDVQSIMDIFDEQEIDRIALSVMDHSELQWIYDEYVKDK